jgi:gliding motility-associated transport system ATP-binding protein
MIEVKRLSKQFGPKTAVDDISFSVEKGEVLGFLGPNGAGKSTTMRMVTGYIPPTSGSVSINGLDIVENPIEAKRRMGYLPENAPLYADMTVESFLSFAAELRGINGAAHKSAVNRAIETCFLEQVRRQSLDTLSKGYRHRTCLAQAIIHDPEVLILDEPTDGLDPNQKQEVRNLIKRMGANKIIIFSTHILEEVDAACSRAIIIDQGRIVADGSPDELKRRAARAGSVHVRINGLVGSGIKAELEKLPHAESVETIEAGDSGFNGRVMAKKTAVDGTLSAEIFQLCATRQFQLNELHVDEGRLDEMFREITIQTRS